MSSAGMHTMPSRKKTSAFGRNRRAWFLCSGGRGKGSDLSVLQSGCARYLAVSIMSWSVTARASRPARVILASTTICSALRRKSIREAPPPYVGVHSSGRMSSKCDRSSACNRSWTSYSSLISRVCQRCVSCFATGWNRWQISFASSSSVSCHGELRSVAAR
jgi:hypothetical protein